ncbi:Hypothetical protein DEACI_4094 [Acididesulfobacillus acetoxydans]|uniref:Uncharacterized protein n=1 Tax=Acididesulfobacillus acetoxydans TaxID=1561005 RepID=A0A8S0X1S6_9FIRM|nr:Hypothetical protein DEACI_4057 [Acididesulfobacillus acetoxydans]CAA7603271.1 Hypothetical protein DEACI_4094 [Acididesulfobacillus acetoxydans]CEJ07228.1 Hypothetical protein DEACI_1686 [Acididesulfobacillus acetoxydans]
MNFHGLLFFCLDPNGTYRGFTVAILSAQYFLTLVIRFTWQNLIIYLLFIMYCRLLGPHDRMRDDAHNVGSRAALLEALTMFRSCDKHFGNTGTQGED